MIRKFKCLTLQDRKLIESLLIFNPLISYADIGRQVNKHGASIQREINKNGGKEKYNAVKAHKRVQSNAAIKINHIARPSNEQKNNFALRLNNLEMQVEILAETIKELISVKKNK